MSKQESTILLGDTIEYPEGLTARQVNALTRVTDDLNARWNANTCEVKHYIITRLHQGFITVAITIGMNEDAAANFSPKVALSLIKGTTYRFFVSEHGKLSTSDRPKGAKLWQLEAQGQLPAQLHRRRK